MHTYTDDETHASLVRTFPDLTGWSLNNLLGQYADDVAAYREAERAEDELTRRERSRDVDRVAAEIERRTLERDRLLAMANQLHVNLSMLSTYSASLAGAISALPKESNQ